jgi:hypothetical protein
MPTGTAAGQAARNRLQALNNNPDDQAQAAAVQRLQQMNAGLPVYQQVPINSGSILQSRLNNINNIAATQGYRAPAPTPTLTQQARTGSGTTTSSSRRSSGGGGGGGGGGSALPVLSQSQLDWATQLMNGARPGQETANALDLPDYQGMPLAPFDPTMFNQARTAYQQGVTQDLGTANQATQDMLAFFNNNYTNAFNNPNATYATAGQAPGMDQQAMARLLQGQGVNPNVASQTQGEGVQADQAFGNLWRVLAGNEDIAQRNRLSNATQYGNQANAAITAAGRAGNLGIDLGQGQAQAAYQTAAAQRAYENYQAQQQVLQQEALQTWQRGNQVQDTNLTNTNQYNNAMLTALLGLLPQLQANPSLRLPSPQSLGLAQGGGGPGYDPADPLGWKAIAAGIANGSIPQPQAA